MLLGELRDTTTTRSDYAITLVGGGVSEGGLAEADALSGGVVVGVVALEEGVAVDEVNTGANLADISNDAVGGVGVTTNVSVEGAGPDLSVGVERKLVAANVEGEGLELGLATGGELDEAGGVVVGSPGLLDVGVESVGREVDEGCSGVDDTTRGLLDLGVAVADGLADTPVSLGGRDGGDGSIDSGAVEFLE